MKRESNNLNVKLVTCCCHHFFIRSTYSFPFQQIYNERDENDISCSCTLPYKSKSKIIILALRLKYISAAFTEPGADRTLHHSAWDD